VPLTGWPSSETARQVTVIFPTVAKFLILVERRGPDTWVIPSFIIMPFESFTIRKLLCLPFITIGFPSNSTQSKLGKAPIVAPFFGLVFEISPWAYAP